MYELIKAMPDAETLLALEPEELAGKLLPRELLHERIAEPVWLAFARGEYDVAAFLAMKAVEVRVREAAEFGADKIGKDSCRIP